METLLNSRPVYARLCLWLAAVWSGAAVMAFELVGARLLMPTFGMGVEVWAAVIATTLGALAIGYWIGGRLADARPSMTVLGWLFSIAAVSLLGVRLGAHRITAWCGEMDFVAGAWCSAAVVLAVPLVVLGMVQPMLARLLLRSADRAGATVGGLLAVSTIGGVVGTATAGLVLIPHVGVSRTLALLVGGSGIVGVVAWFGGGRWRPGSLAMLLVLASFMASWRTDASPRAEGEASVLEVVEGRHGRLEVIEYHGTKALLCDGIFQTALPESMLGFGQGTLIRAHEYIELIPYLRPRTETALLIGLGGGLHERVLALYGIRVHAVEIDPAVVALATRHFELAADVTIADGRAFLVRDRRRFDAIILDAFLGSSIPEHLYTVEAFQLMDEHLSPEGIVAVHLISHPEHAVTRAIASTLGTVFPNVALACGGIGGELQHLYLFASGGPLDSGAELAADLHEYGFTGREWRAYESGAYPALLDDRPRLAWLGRDLVVEHRRSSLERRSQLSW